MKAFEEMSLNSSQLVEINSSLHEIVQLFVKNNVECDRQSLADNINDIQENLESLDNDLDELNTIPESLKEIARLFSLLKSNSTYDIQHRDEYIKLIENQLLIGAN